MYRADVLQWRHTPRKPTMQKNSEWESDAWRKQPKSGCIHFIATEQRSVCRCIVTRRTNCERISRGSTASEKLALPLKLRPARRQAEMDPCRSRPCLHKEKTIGLNHASSETTS
jgi:hypothetical protein